MLFNYKVLDLRICLISNCALRIQGRQSEQPPVHSGVSAENHVCIRKFSLLKMLERCASVVFQLKLEMTKVKTK